MNKVSGISKGCVYFGLVAKKPVALNSAEEVFLPPILNATDFQLFPTLPVDWSTSTLRAMHLPNVRGTFKDTAG
jgi:hypothetical protein